MILLHTKEFPPVPPQDHVLGSKVNVPESVQGPGPEKIPALLPPLHWQRGLGMEGVTHLESVPFLPPPGPGCCHHSQRAPWSTWTTAASAPSLSRKAPGPYSDLQDPIQSSPSPCSSPTDPTSLLPPGLCPAGSLCPNALLPWLSGSQVGTVVPPRGYLAMSGDILGYNWYGGRLLLVRSG